MHEDQHWHALLCLKADRQTYLFEPSPTLEQARESFAEFLIEFLKDVDEDNSLAGLAQDAAEGALDFMAGKKVNMAIFPCLAPDGKGCETLAARAASFVEFVGQAKTSEIRHLAETLGASVPDDAPPTGFYL